MVVLGSGLVDVGRNGHIRDDNERIDWPRRQGSRSAGSALIGTSLAPYRRLPIDLDIDVVAHTRNVPVRPDEIHMSRMSAIELAFVRIVTIRA